MKKVGKPVFFIVVLLIAALTLTTFFGISTTFGDISTTWVKGVDAIRWGIDVRGGVDVTFGPPEGVEATDEEMAAAEQIIKVRMVSQNITDYEIYTDYDKDRIIVRFPWKEDETDFDPETAIAELGATAVLTFREGYGLLSRYVLCDNLTITDMAVSFILFLFNCPTCIVFLQQPFFFYPISR